ncbi:unnamed protein product [Protopolystoma xenopodis]|uniref:Riboflavin transporter n=1 Tax=Protopolystoma xenopodis TaxID=117903 RepID=A0A3S5AVR0_9PLAT|nr:unnamed protein product [Protopolystoma xenopodis]
MLYTWQVISWCIIGGGFPALRTWCGVYLMEHEGMHTLRLAGAATQLGALVGAIAVYLAVIQFSLFKARMPCT